MNDEIQELQLQKVKLEIEVGDYRYVLLQLKSQLLDTNAEDSLIVSIITNVLNKER